MTQYFHPLYAPCCHLFLMSDCHPVYKMLYVQSVHLLVNPAPTLSFQYDSTVRSRVIVGVGRDLILYCLTCCVLCICALSIGRSGSRIFEWGAQVERRRREYRGAAGAEGSLGRGVPLPNGGGVWEGAPSQNFFKTFWLKIVRFSVYSERIALNLSLVQYLLLTNVFFSVSTVDINCEYDRLTTVPGIRV